MKSRISAIQIIEKFDDCEYLSAEKAAKMIGVCEATLYNLVNAGIITRFKVSTGKKRGISRYKVSQLRRIFKPEKNHSDFKELSQDAQNQ
jgi:hypothetical protein